MEEFVLTELVRLAAAELATPTATASATPVRAPLESVGDATLQRAEITLARCAEQLARLGADFTPLETADQVAALLAAMARYPEGTPHRSAHIYEVMHPVSPISSVWTVEQLLARLSHRSGWMQLVRSQPIESDRKKHLTLVPPVDACVACGCTRESRTRGKASTPAGLQMRPRVASGAPLSYWQGRLRRGHRSSAHAFWSTQRTTT